MTNLLVTIQMSSPQFLYLAMTNAPGQPADWEPPSESPIEYRGNTINDQWWFASPSRDKLNAIIAELRAKNPNPVPRITITMEMVDQIPVGFR